MNDFNLLLQAIITNPDEDAVRLAMADWYEEHGQSERAEFIRVQVELASLTIEDTDSLGGGIRAVGKYHRKRDRLLDRERELTDKLWEGMRPFVLLVPNKWEFTRGFISHITCSAEDFLKHADQLVWHPEMTNTCKNCHNGYVPTDREDNECENPVCDRGRVPRPCPDTAQPIRKVKLTTYSGFPIGENALQHVNVREYFQSRPFPYSDYFRVRGWDQFRPMVPVQGKLNHYTCDVWPGIEFECLPSMVDVRLNSGGRGVVAVEAGPNSIQQNDLIASDMEGRAFPAGRTRQDDWIIGTATGPPRV